MIEFQRKRISSSLPGDWTYPLQGCGSTSHGIVRPTQQHAMPHHVPAATAANRAYIRPVVVLLTFISCPGESILSCCCTVLWKHDLNEQANWLHVRSLSLSLVPVSAVPKRTKEIAMLMAPRSNMALSNSGIPPPPDAFFLPHHTLIPPVSSASSTGQVAASLFQLLTSLSTPFSTLSCC